MAFVLLSHIYIYTHIYTYIHIYIYMYVYIPTYVPFLILIHMKKSINNQTILTNQLVV